MSTTVLLNIGLFLALGIGALIYHPILAICGYIIVYALYSTNVWWSAALYSYYSRPSLLMAIFLFVAILIHHKKIHWQFKSSGNRELLIYLFGCWLWFTIITGVKIDLSPDSWFILIKMTKIFVFIFMFIRVVNTLQLYKTAVWAIILTGIVLGYQGSFASEGAYIGGRLEMLGGTDFAASNELSIYLAVGITFLGVELLRSSFWKKLPYIFAIALMLNAIILTRSRGVIIAFLAALPYAIFRSPTKNKKVVLVMSLLGIILFWKLSDVTFFIRMQTMTQVESTASERLGIWEASIPMFLDHPLGVGVGNFQNIIGHYLRKDVKKDAHNTFILCYGELGLIGITLYLMILIRVFTQIKRIKMLIKDTGIEDEILAHCYAIILANLICVFGFLVHSGLYMEYVWWILVMPICLENVVRNLNKKPLQNRR